MTWICPTFQRPHRLAELAASWERCEPDRALFVRVWEDDPYKDTYFDYQWPEYWILYESPAKGAGEALQEFFRMHPNEESYGFIGDDCVLRTPGGLKILEDTAGDWFYAYPNDVLQRHRMATHLCVGGELARTVGYFTHPNFKHNMIDVIWMNLAQHTGVGRYCPQVIFQHKHFLKYPDIEKDDTYRLVYPGDDNNPHGEMQDEAVKEFTIWAKGGGFQRDVNKIRQAFLNNFEHYSEWEDEDAVVHYSTG